MERFRVETTRQADKDLDRLKALKDDAEQALLILEHDPWAGEILSASLSGSRSLHFSLKGSGEYRAAYVVLTEERVCLVYMVATRENFYRVAERRYRAMGRRRR